MTTKQFLQALGYNRHVKKLLRSLHEHHLLTDKQFLSIKFLLKDGRRINWKNPKSFREKCNWLKLYDQRPEYTTLVDKVKVKEWAAGIIGDEYIIPTLAVWDRPEDVDFSVLPSRYVLKCNHTTGGNYIHTTEDEPDKEAVLALLKRKFADKPFYRICEWPYKNVEKKILAEAYIDDPDNARLIDYKFYCFNGVPHYIQINSHSTHEVFSDNRNDRIRDYQGFYDMEWNKQEFTQEFPYHNDVYTPKPENFDKMAELAVKLSKGIPFVRVDFYNIKGKIYLGEMTLYPYGGIGAIRPEKWDFILGDLLELDLNHKIVEKKR